MKEKTDDPEMTAAGRSSPRNTLTSHRRRLKEIERRDWSTRLHVRESCPAIGANPSSEFTNSPPATPTVLMIHSRSYRSLLRVFKIW